MRHLFFYYLGLMMFWPMHIFRLNVHPLLVTIMRVQKLARGFLERLRRGDPLAVFAVTVVFFTWIAFAAAVLAWWAGSSTCHSPIQSFVSFVRSLSRMNAAQLKTRCGRGLRSTRSP